MRRLICSEAIVFGATLGSGDTASSLLETGIARLPVWWIGSQRVPTWPSSVGRAAQDLCWLRLGGHFRAQQMLANGATSKQSAFVQQDSCDQTMPDCQFSMDPFGVTGIGGESVVLLELFSRDRDAPPSGPGGQGAPGSVDTTQLSGIITKM